MKRDYGSEHDRGGLSLGGGSQPNEPALGREFDTPKVPPIPPKGPAFAGPATTLSRQVVARNRAPTQGDKSGNDHLSSSMDSSAAGSFGSLEGPPSANDAQQLDPRQNIFEALCDDPSLTREDALALLAIRDGADPHYLHFSYHHHRRYLMQRRGRRRRGLRRKTKKAWAH